MIGYFTQQFKFTEATHVFFPRYLFQKKKKVFALVSKQLKDI